MPTNEFLPFAADPAANILTQAQYAADAKRTAGEAPGTASAKRSNKAWRQSSIMAAALAEFIMQQTGADVLDDGDTAALTARITAAVQSLGYSTGDMKSTLKIVADAGWVFLNDGTIGNTSSAASTRANVDCLDLFVLLWESYPQTVCAVSGGRGANAAADFNAQKRIGLPAAAGRALGVAGAGASLTNRTAGSTVGAENHQLTVAELAAHTHKYDDAYYAEVSAGNAGIIGSHGGTDSDNNYFYRTPQPTTESAGTGTAHNNMQPTAFFNVMVKL